MAVSPHYFLHGNLVFARGADDAWGAFRLLGQSYPGLSVARKIEVKQRLEALAYGIETDFQLIRTAREWRADEYARRALATLDPHHGHGEGFTRLVDEHRRRLEGRRIVRPEVFLFVRLAPPLHSGDLADRLAEIWRALGRRVGLSDARGLGPRELAELRTTEGRCFERISDYVPCERARSGEVAHIIRAAYTRGLGEPRMDQNWRPQALWLEESEEDGGVPRFEPYEHDLLRLHESRVEIGGRGLRVESELGTSHQTMLVLGALPEEASFPGAEAELLFAPLEVDFPVDASYACDYIPNRAAQRLAQRRMVDADQQAKEEGFGEHGPSPQTSEKTHAARELQMRLAGTDRAPLLRSAITVCVGAPSAEELAERVERLRRAFGNVELHRPLGDQHRLFLAAMPAQLFPAPEYKAHLLPEQFGAMVPTAISHAGSEIGPYIGHALGGSQAPIQFDLAEACRQNRPPSVLMTGSLGSGKTVAMMTLEYHAFLQGSTPIVDIDPKGDGDHGLLGLPEVAERTEVIELGPEPRYRGLLDPLRVAPPETRDQVTYNFLTSILPEPVPPEWRTEIRAAVAEVAGREHATVGDVLVELRRVGGAGRDAERALEVHLEAGFARLGFGEQGLSTREVGDAQVIALQIRSLPRPLPGTARSEMQEDERIGQAVLRLVAAYAMRLCMQEKATHAVLALDEAWALLSDSQGKDLVKRFSRMGRSANVTPILASQIVGDASEMEPLVGSYFAFGVETESEAERSLELLRLDSDDAGLHQRLMAFRAGRCFFRDFDGRVAPMRVEPGAELLEALDTTPRREDAPSPRAEGQAVVEENGDAVRG